ncbi:DUF4893 domain-containing protein [Sphingomicrobium sp. XHP0239]|uniref:DUF4893 domain-containing protein n=1 Tax=Sphingomicrobium maritimum TaxID=3133972 RepID=UPI0031CCBF8A
MRPSLAATVTTLAALTSGCAALTADEGLVPVAPSASIEPELDPDANWRGYAAPADADRIEMLGAAWTEGLAAAREADFVTAIEEQGALLDPEAGLERPDPTPGSYQCRLVKLGAASPGDPAFIAYQPFFCYVEIEADRFTIVKQTGSQRPAGRLYDAGNRYIFLGSLALGSEREPMSYGEDPTRDMAGVWERVGPFRWRLSIPYPRNGGILDVFELVPTGEQPDAG